MARFMRRGAPLGFRATLAPFSVVAATNGGRRRLLLKAPHTVQNSSAPSNNNRCLQAVGEEEQRPSFTTRAAFQKVRAETNRLC